jgi:ElaB/YqjD/DUF883 family membrane-anchored ribosome-binding protein
MSSTMVMEQPARAGEPRISWGAVFAGLVLALATYLVLGLLGTAIGSGSIDPLQEQNPLAGFGTGAGIWAGVTTVIALAVGAYIAGRGAPLRGALHGVLVWAATTLVTVYLFSSLAGSVFGTATQVAGSGISAAGQGLASVAPGVANSVKEQMQRSGVSFDFNDARRELETILRQSGKPELAPEQIKSRAESAAGDGKATAESAGSQPQASGDEIGDFFKRLRDRAQPVLESADREALVNIIAARTGKSREEAGQIAANYEKTYNQAVAKYDELKKQAEQKAREAADVAARGLSQAAWAGLGVLVVGLLVSAGAGVAGARSASRRIRVA